ncbi:O-methylsterigmatocystin oxidoreductase [Purpureocillium lavendulum]|uniref:O-methylsterigmatocystin oxidoreductase n=1 Tax=Purpureocillium lavendulum TaxID=1247861 RepID=A0AB34FY68_9HYPO|nr:O-methylsterigmatocystin oxidoreductase [Purpureocillium lavendulum]
MALARLLLGPPGLALLAAAVLFLVAKAVAASRAWRRRPSLPLPPGPPGEPVLGHLRVVPAYGPEYTYMRWSREYGSDVLFLRVLGQPVVVLNSVRAAVDLLDKRGANYCDRPRFVLFEVMGWGKTLTFLRHGPDFRTHRRILQKSFQKSSIVQYQALQSRETAVMLKGIVAGPADWDKALRRFATAVVLGIGFGININSDDDPFIQVAADASYALGHGGAPAGTPVDFFPFMRWLPRCFHDRSLKFAADWRWAIRGLHDKPFDAVLASRERRPSLIKEMLDQREQQLKREETPELTHEDIKGAAGAVFAAGQDTTWATLIVVILNMVLHPEVQVKARRLLDDVVGRDRLPSFKDRPRLTYIDHIVQEALRWCPVSPIGVPHRSLEDDVYNGYLIPAGSFVYANARAMTHDPDTYSDPDGFNPDRYAPVAEGGLGEPFPNGQFGFGRRVCIGKHLAEASVWIVVASMLSTMKIEKERDEHGNDVEPEVELTQGLTSHPKQFPCRIVPRDERAAALVEQTET